MNLASEMRAFLADGGLVERGRALSADYRSAEPFPHIVIDDLFPPPVVEALASAIGSPDSESWLLRDNPQSLKRGCADELAMAPEVQAFLHFLNSGPFLRLLEALTGIEGLVGDPHLRGGGLHQIEPGGFLKIHADFNVQEELKLDRRLNLLLYLNADWDPDWGGDLELWDREMQACRRKISPILNRCVVFSTTDDSFHGHPTPLACPEGRTRKSVALYYYTNGRPAAERSSSHGTLYRARPGEELPAAGGGALARAASAWLPPILLSALRSLRGGRAR